MAVEGLSVLVAGACASGDPHHTSRALRARLPSPPLSAQLCSGVSLENGTCIRPTVTLIAYYLPIRHVWVQQRPSYQQGRYDVQYSAYPPTRATDAGTMEVYQQCFSKDSLYQVYCIF